MPKNRITALFIGLVLCFIIAMSSVFMATHAHHDCIDVHGPSCQQIDLCETLLQNIAAGVGAVLVLCMAAVFVAVQIIFIYKSVSQRVTLVSLKVKLSN